MCICIGGLSIPKFPLICSVSFCIPQNFLYTLSPSHRMIMANLSIWVAPLHRETINQPNTPARRRNTGHLVISIFPVAALRSNSDWATACVGTLALQNTTKCGIEYKITQLSLLLHVIIGTLPIQYSATHHLSLGSISLLYLPTVLHKQVHYWTLTYDSKHMLLVRE